MSSSGNDGSSASPSVTGEGKNKRKWKRGHHMTAAKRAKQLNNEFELRGECMWCIACAVPVDWKEKCTAKRHLKSKGHLKCKAKGRLLVSKSGPSADICPLPIAASTLEGLPFTLCVFFSVFNPSASPAPAPPKKQADLKRMLDNQNEADNISDGFVAAFLHAGIPVAKLDHPSVRGVL